MKNIFKILGFSVLQGAKQGGSRLHPLVSFLGVFLKGRQDSGMMNRFDKSRFFKPTNRGLLIDGKTSRLSEKESMNHLAVIARSGAGKTTSYIIPNIYTLAQQNSSMVITDLSGELFDLTSGYLKEKGFKIHVLDPEKLEESIRYNPLYYATSSQAIDEVSEILVRSANPGEIRPEDKIWLDGAKTFISILIKLLLQIKDHRYINLGNVRYLINNFGNLGVALYPLVSKYADEKTYHEFKGFVSGNPKTVLSYVSTANTALSPIGINDNLEMLTKGHTIDFEAFRKEKTALYIRIPPHKQAQYSFLLNLFYFQFFNTMMSKLPAPNDFPIYCLLDEFGNMQLPHFSTTITTIRKYKVSVSVVLQDLNQLQSRYGKHEAATIINGGVASRIFYGGADLEITEMLEKMLGKKESTKIRVDGEIYTRDEPVIDVRAIRTMKDNEILFIYSNKPPVIMKTKPYYEDFLFVRYSSIPAHIPDKKESGDLMEYIELPTDDEEY